jgi:hypothetical protein
MNDDDDDAAGLTELAGRTNRANKNKTTTLTASNPNSKVVHSYKIVHVLV